jgi:hypothetical protein
MTHYFVSNGTTDLEVLIADGTDLDGTFEAIDVETGELLRINGWQADTIEAIGADMAVTL